MKNTKFKWKCIHCGKYNIAPLKFQFEVPNKYEVDWECSKCGKETKIIFDLKIWYAK